MQKKGTADMGKPKTEIGLGNEKRDALLSKIKDDDATVGEMFQIKRELGLTDEEFCELLNT